MTLHVANVIGTGRVGTVYADVIGGRRVAVKRVPSAHAGVLRRDWEVLSTVSHPHLVPALHYTETPTGAELVMSRADASFETVVPETRTLLRLVEQVAQGLDALHRAGWVHCDVKPANLLLHGRDVWLADFGLARHRSDPGPCAPIGTLPYMAPEAFLWQSGVECDWFALGVTIYELLTGRLPFDEETLQGEILAKQGRRYPPLPLMATPWRTLVDGLLTPQPDERWTAVDVLAWVDAVTRPVSVSA